MAHESSNIQLPLNVITVVDLGRLVRELAAIDDFAIQSADRQAGKQPKLPRTSKSLDELASANGFNLLLEADRKKLDVLLKSLHEHAPVIHMSFASDPPANFLAKIITWLRNEIHPQILLQVGLQPSIAAGCIMRTPNKYFDFSLRKHFDKSRQLLIDSLVGSSETSG